MPEYKNTLEYALEMDQNDPLKKYREQFYLPKGPTGKQAIYLCGNSLGLQPKSTAGAIQQELDDWAQLGVEGHIEAKNPWLPYHEFLTKPMAKLVGAKPSEVVVMNSLTANLHFLMVSFFRPTEKRFKIIMEIDAFPSDRYAIESQLRFHGLDVEKSLVLLKPRAGEVTLRTEDVVQTIQNEADQLAMVLIGGVNYYTGQVFDIKTITKATHDAGATAGWDLAHGTGNIELKLHDWNVDFAAWCTYKYLNSGPGAVAGAFVHQKHLGNPDIPRFEGWWGHDKQTRFKMGPEFNPIPTVEAWQLSNPPIMALAPIKASLAIFEEVGLTALIQKSRLLTGYLAYLLDSAGGFTVITPENEAERGCQLSIQVKNGNKALFDAITAKDVIADWREPDVIRVAPIPLYNTFEEMYQFVQILRESQL